MRNGRCRLDGVLSTGSKTLEGIERLSRAQLKHGQHTKEARAERAEVPRFARELKAAIEVLDSLGVYSFSPKRVPYSAGTSPRRGEHIVTSRLQRWMCRSRSCLLPLPRSLANAASDSKFDWRPSLILFVISKTYRFRPVGIGEETSTFALRGRRLKIVAF